MGKKANIFIGFHKYLDYGVWCDDIHIPLELGADYHPERIMEKGVRDNDGNDNISIWNPLFLENTGLYWIWRQLENVCSLLFNRDTDHTMYDV